MWQTSQADRCPSTWSQKKAVGNDSQELMQVATDDCNHDTGARLIHWYTMDVISGGQSTLFATSKLFLQTEFYGWENWPRLQRKTSLPSMVFSCRVMCDIINHMYIPRERREHRVFQELLKSVAGLEERLMQGGDNEVDIVAELASTMASYVFKFSFISHITSSPRAHLGQGVMIPKVSKAVCSTGLPRRDRILFLLLPAT